MKPLKVLIACGGGIATSSYAAAEIKKIADEANVKIEIHKDRILNIPSEAKNYDLCCVTSKYAQNISTPLVQVDGLITGINEEKVREKIKNKLLELSNS